MLLLLLFLLLLLLLLLFQLLLLRRPTHRQHERCGVRCYGVTGSKMTSSVSRIVPQGGAKSSFL